jgi:DNA-directed RNA polymerase subunit M/transcription elongation factor TFIIS
MVQQRDPRETLGALAHLWSGTTEEVSQLVSFRFRSGEPLVGPNRDLLLEVIGMLQRQPFATVFAFLESCPSSQEMLWEQEGMEEGRAAVEREITIQRAEEVGVKGVGRCRFCPSTELVFATMQLRSADEPMATLVRCVLCNKGWQQ